MHDDRHRLQYDRSGPQQQCSSSGDLFNETTLPTTSAGSPVLSGLRRAL